MGAPDPAFPATAPLAICLQVAADPLAGIEHFHSAGVAWAKVNALGRPGITNFTAQVSPTLTSRLHLGTANS